MATILLSAAGAAVGGLSSGTFLGLTGAVIGRAVGATIGRVIDQRLLGVGSEVIEQGKMDRFRLTGASEGAAIQRLLGRMRIGGQVIWATKFKEHVTTTGGGGKGAPPQPKVNSYSYSVSLAVALCEGEIARVGRIWADGNEIAPNDLNLRVYTGTEDQMPDPLIEATEGAGNVPAYRGTAYVVIEDLDLSPYGNRVPQFSFEVVRPAQPEHLDVADPVHKAVRGVAMMPGSGEYALATTPVSLSAGFGQTRSANVHTASGISDLETSLEQLTGELPNCQAVSLIVSWFGDDLRAGQCTVKPKVEQKEADGREMPWRVSGLTRSSAELISQLNDRPVYGGTPSDQSVIEAIEALNEAGQDVLFYPFLLMEILAGSGKPNPWSESGEQAPLPWRGRITGEKAPGLTGSPDGTAAAKAEVDAFFGTATAADFTITPGSVSYSGPAEWSYSRFILHCAALAAAAGGVESFCVGSEMRALTQMRDDGGFPAVDALIALTAEVRSLLPDAKLSYAADWSEYFGYQPQDGSGDVYFHLDPLWANPEIDFIGIDNYMPLSDWRDGPDHADAHYKSIYNLDYLTANIEGGEGYDWYYASPDARESQNRTPITDGAHGEDWIYRYKDIANWWSQPHIGRRGPYRLDDRPLFGTDRFGGDMEDPTYWLRHWFQDLDEIETANLIDSHSNVEWVNDPYEGPVLQVTGTARYSSERGHRPFIEGQKIKASIRTRLLAEQLDGNEHRFRVYVCCFDDQGNYSGYRMLTTFSDLKVGDGWVVREVVFDPWELRKTGSLSSDCAHWRFVIGLNGWTPYNPAGAVQQISEISIEPYFGADAWQPQSKPIRFTELGCGAIDKGTNQPNKFLDPKSSESAAPYYSNGQRDDTIQAQYLRAMTSYWSDPDNNPISEVYDAPMLDMDHAYVWAWDARPWPAFPNDRELWSDGANHAKGHWLTGRAASQDLAMVVAEICEEAGLLDYDVSELFGSVRGVISTEVESARARLQPLMLAYGFEAVERDGKIVFRSRLGIPDAKVESDLLALDDDGRATPLMRRQPDAETVGRVRLSHVEAEGNFEARLAEASFPDDSSDKISHSELPMALSRTEGRGVVERWLAESRIARDSVLFSLPPSRRDIGAGSVVEFEDGSTWRIDRIEDAGARHAEAVRSEAEVFTPSDAVDEPVGQPRFVAPTPVTPLFMDLPLLTGEEVEHAPHLAVAAKPWPGLVALYSSSEDAGYKLNESFGSGAVAGLLETPLKRAEPGVWDRGAPVFVRLLTGSLSSASLEAVLNGANAAAIGSGSGDDWEVIQFADANLVAPGLWEVSMRLRGQAGSDGVMPTEWPVGSYFVLLDGRPKQIDLALSARGLERHYRIGPAAKSYDHASYVHEVQSFDGVGLRPYPPAHLKAPETAAGRSISWIRRTRIDGDSWQGAEVPLGEAFERYRLRISDAGGVKREFELTDTSFDYSAAMQAADGLLSSYSIEVAQISESFGPGPFARIEIND